MVRNRNSFKLAVSQQNLACYPLRLQLGVPVCSTDVTASDGFQCDEQRWFLETETETLAVSQQPRVLSFAFTLQGDPSGGSPKSLMVISLGSIPGRII